MNGEMKMFVEISFFMLCICHCITVPVGSAGIHLDPSKSFRYSYEAEVILNEADLSSSDKEHRIHVDVGLKVGAVFDLNAIWTSSQNPHDQIIEMKFEEAEIFNVSDRVKSDNTFHSVRRSKPLRSITMPLLFRWTDGKIEAMYVNVVETVASLNLKRGMLGMLQLQTQSGNRTEDDPSGSCVTTYEVNGVEVKKVKDINSCENNEYSHTVLNQALGVSTVSTSSSLYTLSDDLSHILFAVAMESRYIRLNIKQDISLFVVGRQKMGLLNSEESKSSRKYSSDEEALQAFAKERKKSGDSYVRDSLVSERDVKDCAEGCLKINDVVELYRDELTGDNMANRSSVQAYISAVRAARQADKKTLLEVFQDKKNKDIRLTLIDVLAATQTPSSQAVLMKILDFSKTENTGDIERALTGIAFSSHPSHGVVNDLKEVFKGSIGSPKVRETVGLALGAVLNKYCRITKENCNKKVAKEVVKLIHDGLDSASSEDDETLFIQLIRNSALSEFIPRLLHFAENSKHPLVHHLAINTLSVFEVDELPDDMLVVMNRIFHQNKHQYETTVRSAAANIVLTSQPSKRDIQNILLSLPHLKSHELANFIYARVQDLINTNHPSKLILLDVLSDTSYGNYWILAQSGMASAYTGNYFNSSDSSSTYALFMEYSNAGMMRRTAVDFSIHSQEDSIALTQLGIVAQGLEGLTGSAPDEGEEELDSMVGMASSMLGVKLRPLTFFRGYSNMMSMIWSGGSGDPAGVEAMLMLSDHMEHVLLASGLRIKSEIMAAISTKITAEIAFSLWNRNVEIVTKNGGALSVQCRLTLESPIIRASVRNQLDSQSALLFSVFTDFSSLPPKSCMRLSYSPFEYEKSLRKFEKVKGSKKKLLSMWRQRHQVRGTTLPLHRGNSLMCEKILNS